MLDQFVVDGRVLATIEFPGELAGLVKEWDVSYEVGTEAELRQIAGAFGGIERLAGDGDLLTYRPPDNSTFAKSTGGRSLTVYVWLRDELAERPTPVPPTVLKRLRDEAAVRNESLRVVEAREAAERGGVGEPHVDNEGHAVHDAGGPIEQVRP